jgi:hypothetical protein
MGWAKYSWGELSHGLTELQEDVIADNIESLELEIINRIQTKILFAGCCSRIRFYEHFY